MERFQDQPGILAKMCRVQRIKGIETYEIYGCVIDGCREAAKLLGCSLIEVEQLWQGAVTPVAKQGLDAENPNMHVDEH